MLFHPINLRRLFSIYGHCYLSVLIRCQMELVFRFETSGIFIINSMTFCYHTILLPLEIHRHKKWWIEGEGGMKRTIEERDKKALLELSRYVLKSFVEEGRDDFVSSVLEKFNISDALKEVMGVFVTLRKRGELRGCIGHIVGYYPLYEGVIINTLNAAANDPRFPGVMPEELGDIEIEISILTPPEEIENLDEVKVGETGLVLENRGHTGVFLPHVPIEQHWDKKTYLEQLGRKAGLDINAYKDRHTRLLGFSAIVIHE